MNVAFLGATKGADGGITPYEPARFGRKILKPLTCYRLARTCLLRRRRIARHRSHETVAARLRYGQEVNGRELERKAEIAQLLLHAAHQLAETLEPERVYDRFHELLADVIPHDGVVVSSYDELEGLIRCEYAWVEGNRVDPASLPPLPLNRDGGGMQSGVIVSGEPLLANDVAARVEQGEGTYYNVDREGNVRKIPEAGPAGVQLEGDQPEEDEQQPAADPPDDPARSRPPHHCSAHDNHPLERTKGKKSTLADRALIRLPPFVRCTSSCREGAP